MDEKGLIAFLFSLIVNSHAADDLKSVDGGLQSVEYELRLDNEGFSVIFKNDWEVSLKTFMGNLFYDVRVPLTATTVPSHGGGQVHHWYAEMASQWYNVTVDYLLSLPAEASELATI